MATSLIAKRKKSLLEKRGGVESQANLTPEVTMLRQLSSIGARQVDFRSPLTSPILAKVKEENTTSFLRAAAQFNRNNEWSSDLVKDIALISLKGCVLSPLIDLAMMVEGVVRAIAGAIVWGASWIPSKWAEQIQELGETLVWSGYIGVAGGGVLFANDVGTIPLCATRIVQTVWRLVHETIEKEKEEEEEVSGSD